MVGTEDRSVDGVGAVLHDGYPGTAQGSDDRATGPGTEIGRTDTDFVGQ